MQTVKSASESVDTVYLEPIMVIIPAGSFWQGEPEAAKRVNTGSYAISKYPSPTLSSSRQSRLVCSRHVESGAATSHLRIGLITP